MIVSPTPQSIRARGMRRLACATLLALALAACQSTPVLPGVPQSAPAPGNAEPPAPPRPEPPPVRAVRVGLALGSGAARGFAHVGVIRALESRGIQPVILAGTSAGSFAGALYASGVSGTELGRMALQFEETEITDWSLPARGIFKGEALQNFVNQHVGGRPIEALPRRLAIVATDLHSGDMVVFERGNVGMAVRASSSVPGVFRPVEISGHEYVDGGLVSPVPVLVARRMGADVVIAVDITRRPASMEVNGTFDVLLQTFNIMEHVIAQREIELADVVLRPAVGTKSSTDFRSREDSILAGERAVADAAGAIDAALAAARTRLEAERDAAAAAQAAVPATPPVPSPTQPAPTPASPAGASAPQTGAPAVPER